MGSLKDGREVQVRADTGDRTGELSRVSGPRRRKQAEMGNIRHRTPPQRAVPYLQAWGIEDGGHTRLREMGRIGENI